MKTRTEISIKPFVGRIDYASRIFALGSCFAENVAARMRRVKLRVDSNPTGVLFNPLSIAEALKRFAACDTCAEMYHVGERWFSFAAHTSLDGPSREEAQRLFSEAVRRGYEALEAADTVVLTFGTAWVYERDGAVVANCHKCPQTEFIRRRLTIEEIVSAYQPLLEGVLRDKYIVLTVSPVRHISDGLDGNCVSKAVLRLAAEELCGRFGNVSYFPSYEILVDDLRDYRYYADDLVHPSSLAVEYVWELFAKTALSEEAQWLMPHVERLVAAAEHRPFNPAGRDYSDFCRRTVEVMQSEAMRGVDFEVECARLAQYIK